MLCALIVGVLSVGSGVARASIVEALSLEQLVAHSSHVVLAEAVDQVSLRDSRNRIVTDFTLRVQEVFKGQVRAGADLQMRRLGGVLGDLGMRVEGEPNLQLGHRYLLFLRETPTLPALRPVGMSQGVMEVTDHANTTMVTPGGTGLRLVQSASDGALRTAPAALLHPQSLDRTRAQLHEVLTVSGTDREDPTGSASPAPTATSPLGGRP